MKFIRALILALCLAPTAFAAQQTVNIGAAPGDGTGDQGRTAFQKVNANFSELYGLIGSNTLLATTYGFVCDGVTDNATPMTNLNTAIAALGSAGGSVYFAPQTAACLTSVALVPKSNVTVYALSGTVILKPTVSSTANPILLSVTGGGQSNIFIYGLIFDGGGSTFGTANPVLSIGGVSNFVLDTVTVQNSRGRGAFFGGNVTSSGVRNGVFKNIGNFWKTTLNRNDRYPAVLFQTVATNKNNFIRGSYFEDIGLDAMAVLNQSNFNISNNTCSIYNNQYTLITSSDFPNCIYFSTDIGGSITGNTLAGANGNGIGLEGSTGVSVTGNFIRDSGGAGITVPDTDVGITLGGNTAVDNNQYASTPFPGGFVLTGTTNKVTLTGNTAYDDQGSKTQQYGLDYSTFAGAVTANELQLSGNNFAGNLTGPIGGSPALNMSSPTWGLTGITASVPAQTYNDTTTGSGGVTNDAAVAIGAATFTNTQGTANILANGYGFYIAAPICGSGWASCTSLYSIFAAGRIGGNNGASIIGSINLNFNSNNPVGINTGNSTGTTTVGNALSTFTLSAGTINGAGWSSLPAIASTGSITPGTTIVHGVTVLCQSGATVTGGSVTTEVNLAACTVPANYMGTNGVLRVTITWSDTATAVAKTANIRYSTSAGTPGSAFSSGTAVMSSALTVSDASAQSMTIIRENNATNSQSTFNQSFSPFLAGAVPAATASSITTTNASFVNIDCIDASANGTTETCGISGYTVELISP